MPRSLHTLKYTRYLVFFMSSITVIGCQTAPKKTPIQPIAPWLHKIVGQYKGEVFSGSLMLPITTTFTLNTNHQIQGHYVFTEQSGKVDGKLFNCRSNTPVILQCQWQDKYGTGNLSVFFNQTITEFTGQWNIQGDSQTFTWSGHKYAYNSSQD